MEALFGKQFWVVHLAFLAGCAFLSARAGNQFVAWALINSAQAATHAQPPSARAPERRKAVPTIRDVGDEGNIFGVKPEKEPDPVALAAPAPEEKRGPAGGKPVPTTLRLKLVGVTWFEGAEELSLASIQDLASNETEQFSPQPCPSAPAVAEDEDDEEVEGRVTPLRPCNQMKAGTLIRVERLIDDETTKVNYHAVFENKQTSRLEFLSLHDEGKAAVPEPGAPPPPAEAKGEEPTGDGPELGKGITKLADNQYKIPQGDIDEVMANMNSVATQARIVPSFENGKANGFKLFSIRPNSVFGKIGIQNGDVISRINGYEITSPDKALEVYAKMKDAKELTVELKRRGQPVTMNYNIQ